MRNYAVTMAAWVFCSSQSQAFVTPRNVRLVAPLVGPLRPSRLFVEKATKKQSWKNAFISSISQRANERKGLKFITAERDSSWLQLSTLLRVGIPSLFAGAVAMIIFPSVSMSIASSVNDAGAFAVLSQDASQFVQNYLSVAGLLFSILVGQTYYFLYTQQESIYYALFNEVTEAKSLLEQVALVCQGRSMYRQCLDSISSYVRNDLKKIQTDPAVLLSARPVDDPLESIMYMTSVGIPSYVYETVKSLREARAARLGALQRKLPAIHMSLLWTLAAILIVSFPLLGAGTQIIGGYKILTVEGTLFGVMTAGIVLTLRIVGELWRPAGGAYNVDGVLSVMVRGLEEELRARLNNTANYRSSRKAPSAPLDPPRLSDEDDNSPAVVQQQGADIGVALRRVAGWIRGRCSKKTQP